MYNSESKANENAVVQVSTICSDINHAIGIVYTHLLLHM